MVSRYRFAKARPLAYNLPYMTVKKYNPSEIEPKWQKEWENAGIYATPKVAKSKKYILDMFPYPSGASMHVGHLEGYVGTDIISRYERMKGNVVLHPMGWDAFGLPAENYAVKTGIHPQESTHKNIETFKRQLSITGLSYDWDREIDTSSPEFYKWTQWLFALMYKRGLAYKKEADVNWCPSCETVLANEQVVDGRCERCDTEVVQKKLSQWFLKITNYSDRLISGLTQIDWLEEVKVQQKNWIGKSEGLIFTAPVKDSKLKIQTFSAHFEAFCADTFVVIAPDHPFLETLLEGVVNKEEILKFCKKLIEKRQKRGVVEGKESEGIFSGRYIVDPVGNGDLPIWVASYALKDYGTGIVKCSAHDERDFRFAKKYGIRLKPVLFPKRAKHRKKIENLEECFIDMVNGYLTEPVELQGRRAGDVRQEVIKYVVKNKLAKPVTKYHLRDWLISRQRYWGAPIPMVYCDKCAERGKGERDDMPGWYLVPEDELPVILPKDVDFRPTGESPLARSKTFQKGAICPGCGVKAKREVDTMDTYVDSSWYFIRFTDPQNDREFASQKAIKQWLPVDTYVGGGHVVQHLLFARFFWKVLFDAGLIDKTLGDEPFLKLRAPGWILGPDSRKMSKRWNNVVTPDDIIPKYGADTLRMYEMFMGPFEAMKPWSLTGVEGMWRFVNRVWRIVTEYHDIVLTDADDTRDILRARHKLVQTITKDIEELHFNTAIASLMEFVNLLQDKAQGKVRRVGTSKVRCAEWDEALRTLVLLLAPFAPHMTEELWQNVLDQKGAVHLAPWPTFATELATELIQEIPVQVNGKLRGTVQIDNSEADKQSIIEAKARALDGVSRYLTGKVKKVVFVPGRLINFVTA